MLVHIYPNREEVLHATAMKNKASIDIPKDIYARYLSAIQEWEAVQKLLWKHVPSEDSNANSI